MGFFDRHAPQQERWISPQGRVQRAPLAGLGNSPQDDSPAPHAPVSGLSWMLALKIGGGVAVLAYMLGKYVGMKQGKLAGAEATLNEVRRQIGEKRQRAAQMMAEASGDMQPEEPDADTSVNGTSVKDVLAEVDDNDPKKWLM